jgi:two-component system chemotaxis response regulator CheB
LPVSELADVLVRLTAHAGSFEAERKEVDEMTETAPAPDAEQAQPGELMPFVCPDCGGNMWETEENGVHSFRCRVGHAFAMQTLVAKHGEMVEEALWTAYRALEERAGMSRRLARRLEERGRGESAGRFERQADAAARQAEQLKTILDAVSATGDAEVVSRD